jgi:PAS domain S-box-containing protein
MTTKKKPEQRLEATQRRLKTLRRRAAAVPDRHGLARQALGDLACALEELSSSTDQLRAATDELAATREALEVQRQRNQQLFESAPDGYVITDVTGTIEAANVAALTLLGPRDAIVGKALAAFVAEAERPVFQTKLASLDAKGVGRLQDFELRFLRQDGMMVPVALSAAFVHGPRGVRPRSLGWLLRDVSERKEAEERLREQRDFAEGLIETAQVIVVVLDATGHILRFNRYLEELSGYRLQEVQGKDWFSTFLPRRDHQRIREVFGQAVADVHIQGNVNALLTKDGSEREIEWYAKTLKDAQGRVVGVLSIGLDITERRRAERRLAAQYAVTRALAESSGLDEAMPKLLASLCEGFGVGWEVGELWHVEDSSTVLRWAGMWHTPAVDAAEFEAVSRDLTFAYGDGLPGAVWANGRATWISDVAAAASICRVAAAARAGLNGAFGFPIRSGGNVVGVMNFFSRNTRAPDEEWLDLLDGVGRQIGDFIERKRMEDALFRLAAIVESSDDAIVGTTLDGTITTWNAAAERIYGYTPAEVVGEPISLLAPPDRAGEMHEILERIKAGRSDHYETVRVRKDGTRVHISLSVSPIKDASGRIVGISKIARDITERMRAEAELRDFQKLAHQRERLADIGVITAKILHDLANPLAGLSMQAQLILRRARRTPAQPVSTALEPAERIITEVHHLDALIRDFMDFAREQRLEPRPIDVPRFLRECLDLWQPVATAREIVLVLDAPDGAPVLQADAEKLRRVFDNLLKNAIEAIDRGPGHITMRLSIPVPGKIRISLEDTGPGIPETLQAFRLFETTKPHGTGLGLTIARQIVQAHGGSIEFASLQPHGTVFHIELPYQGVRES